VVFFVLFLSQMVIINSYTLLLLLPFLIHNVSSQPITTIPFGTPTRYVDTASNGQSFYMFTPLYACDYTILLTNENVATSVDFDLGDSPPSGTSQPYNFITLISSPNNFPVESIPVTVAGSYWRGVGSSMYIRTRSVTGTSGSAYTFELRYDNALCAVTSTSTPSATISTGASPSVTPGLVSPSPSPSVPARAEDPISIATSVIMGGVLLAVISICFFSCWIYISRQSNYPTELKATFEASLAKRKLAGASLSARNLTESMNNSPRPSATIATSGKSEVVVPNVLHGVLMGGDSSVASSSTTPKASAASLELPQLDLNSARSSSAALSSSSSTSTAGNSNLRTYPSSFKWFGGSSSKSIMKSN
jgi:hypothetical protein